MMRTSAVFSLLPPMGLYRLLLACIFSAIFFAPLPEFPYLRKHQQKHYDMITEKDAIDLINLAESLGITVFLDGGWGVDALLGRQTREHQDIDLFVLYTNRDLRNGRRRIPLRNTSFSQMRTGGRWTCICLHILQTGRLFLKEKPIRQTPSAEKVVSAKRKCRAFLRRRRSLSIQDTFSMKTMSKTCLPCATVSTSPFQTNICLI